MILITTSRKPSRNTRRFCRCLERVLPLSKYVNRGKAPIDKINERARSEGYRTILVVCETKGNPSMIRVLKDGQWMYQIYITASIGEKPEKTDVEDVRVKTDRFELLKDLFSDYEGKEGITVEEKEGIVRFIYDGKEVGPRIKIRGVDEVPKKLRA